jgi:hypothetical protein
MLLRFVLSLLLIVSPAFAAAPPPSFVAYRKQLQAAIKARSMKALTKLLDPDIRLNFGGGTGIAAFKSIWKPHDPNTGIWKILDLVVNNGGHFNSKTQFAAPYVYSAWPDDIDAFNYAAITREGVELFDGPHESRKAIRKLGYEIIEVLQSSGKPQSETGDDDWSEIKTGDGKRGFVQSKYYRSSIDYRAIFEKRKGKWRMTVLVAGD